MFFFCRIGREQSRGQRIVATQPKHLRIRSAILGNEMAAKYRAPDNMLLYPVQLVQTLDLPNP